VATIFNHQVFDHVGSRSRIDAHAPHVNAASLARAEFIEFEHVAFSYDPENPLITDLSLVAEPGQTEADLPLVDLPARFPATLRKDASWICEKECRVRRRIS
jgi:hypothetical protein